MAYHRTVITQTGAPDTTSRAERKERTRRAILDAIARSRTVAALASPHGVDHYLSRINPMWAAHEVRARVVEVAQRP